MSVANNLTEQLFRSKDFDNGPCAIPRRIFNAAHQVKQQLQLARISAVIVLLLATIWIAAGDANRDATSYDVHALVRRTRAVFTTSKFTDASLRLLHCISCTRAKLPLNSSWIRVYMYIKIHFVYIIESENTISN